MHGSSGLEKEEKWTTCHSHLLGPHWKCGVRFDCMLVVLVMNYWWSSTFANRYVSNKGKVTTDQRVVDQHIDSCLYDLHRILSSDTTDPIFSCYKPAELLSSSSESVGESAGKKSCLENVLRVLGLDTKKVSDTDTLTDLGVDSLQVVTIKSILKGQGVDLPVPEIYKLKIVDLKNVK